MKKKFFTVLSVVFFVSSTSIADDLGRVTEFLRDSTKCYCSSDKSLGSYKIASEKAKSRDGYQILEQQKTISLINLSDEFKPLFKEACQGVETNGNGNCWVRNSYVKIRGGKSEEKYSELNERNRSCEEQGTMMGAEPCED